jgi:molybdopterin synthase catalytic subunit
MTQRVTVQTDDFDVSAEMARLRANDGGVGAVACFVGTVRDRDPSAATTSAASAAVTLMELEHYPGMTESAIERMIDDAHRRFPAVRGVRIIHRVGPLKPNDQIVLVVVTSAHRGESFSACEFLMDYLKTQAPFWKKEHHPDGSAAWVDARVSDDAALQRWGIDAHNAGAAAVATGLKA